ncbi:hypothetical protein DPMN_023515 [Dreissena polymorpha]|uniref:Uncharacterized protein n=1 Tax=Dreissena polymorpha TaxID=45954 RepID=A0A9D4LM90_DREPO|nr:hypothetical protein DPMN_023515 [Dreissena polymorpha]
MDQKYPLLTNFITKFLYGSVKTAWSTAYKLIYQVVQLYDLARAKHKSSVKQGLLRGLVLLVSRGLERLLDLGLVRELVLLVSRGLERLLDLGLVRELVLLVSRGLERLLDLGLVRDLVLLVSRGLERLLDLGLVRELVLLVSRGARSVVGSGIGARASVAGVQGARAVGRGLYIAGGVFGIALIHVDVYTLVNSAIETADGTMPDLSKDIYALADELMKQCLNDAEINQMIEDTIRCL